MKDLIEKLAELEHIQWMKWAKIVMDSEELSQDRTIRWKECMVPYSELPEHQKEYDRKWAREVLKILEKNK